MTRPAFTSRWIGMATLAVAVLIVGVALAPQIAPKLTGLDPTNPKVTLADIEKVVAAKFPVPEMTASDLTAALADPGTIVFDVREPAEQAQSQIPGARLISPNMSGEAFMATHGHEIAGKRVVVYCAVGVRSGIMAQRITQAAKDQAPARVYNLRGGIFRWHASGGRLAAPQSTGPISAPSSGPIAGPISVPVGVHPYDAAWGQLLERTLRKPQ